MNLETECRIAPGTLGPGAVSRCRAGRSGDIAHARWGTHIIDTVTRHTQDQRVGPARRSGIDRRAEVVPISEDRRSGTDRRGRADRRIELHSASGQVRAALSLLTRAVDAGALGDDERQLLDSAMLRLRFALDVFEGE